VNSIKLLSVGGLLILAMMAGCAKEPSGEAAAAESNSRQMQPQDPSLAAIYKRSCHSCHTVAATGAPLTGDSAAWAVRMDKGMSVLVGNVVNGFGGMPPFGMCMDCGIEEFEALIDFMADSGEAKGAAGD